MVQSNVLAPITVGANGEILTRGHRSISIRNISTTNNGTINIFYSDGTIIPVNYSPGGMDRYYCGEMRYIKVISGTFNIIYDLIDDEGRDYYYFGLKDDVFEGVRDYNSSNTYYSDSQARLLQKVGKAGGAYASAEIDQVIDTGAADVVVTADVSPYNSITDVWADVYISMGLDAGTGNLTYMDVVDSQGHVLAKVRGSTSLDFFMGIIRAPIGNLTMTAHNGDTANHYFIGELLQVVP